jgi:hypothetical protein
MEFAKQIPNSYFSTFFEHAYFILRGSSSLLLVAAGAKTIAENLPTWQRPSLMSLWAELENLHILKPRKK